MSLRTIVLSMTEVKPCFIDNQMLSLIEGFSDSHESSELIKLYFEYKELSKAANIETLAISVRQEGILFSFYTGSNNYPQCYVFSPMYGLKWHPITFF